MRPKLNILNNGIKRPIEEFQNGVLRPILKMKNEALMNEFENYLCAKELKYVHLNEMELGKFVLELLKTNFKLFERLTLIILEELKKEEKKLFLKHKKELNKRLKEMLGQRLASNLSKQALDQKGAKNYFLVGFGPVLARF